MLSLFCVCNSGGPSTRGPLDFIYPIAAPLTYTRRLFNATACVYQSLHLQQLQLTKYSELRLHITEQ